MDNQLLKQDTHPPDDRRAELSDEDLEGVVGGLARPWLDSDDAAEWKLEPEPGF